MDIAMWMCLQKMVRVGHFLYISVQLTTVIETRYRKVNDKKLIKTGPVLTDPE